MGKGVANVSGMAKSPEANEEGEYAILNINGIAEINSQINVPPEDYFVG